MNTTSQISNINVTEKTAMFDFFDAIFGWDPQWLDDPTTSSVTMTQILGNNCPELISTSLCYKNKEEYYYTMIPLIIHEFFHGLKKDIHEDQDSPSCDDDVVGKIGNRKINGIVKDSQIKIIESFLDNNINLRFKIIKISVTSKKFINNDIFPRRGDLIKLKYFKKKVFAYVHDINSTETTVQNTRSFIHIYTVMTRDILIIQNQQIKLTSVKPIKQNLRILQAVANLSQSPLCNSIIKPNYHDYHMSIGKKSLSLSSEQKLNSIQMKIVSGVVQTIEESKPKICLIQGPPGTGKSTVITAMIFELINSNRNIKILLCAPSNKAVDGVLLKLIEAQYAMEKKGLNINIVRIGPDEKIDPKVKAAVGLSTLVSKENDFLMRKRSKKESKYEKEVIKNAHVIASTLSSCYSYRMEMIFGKKNGVKIPICIVDEAGQSSEAVTLIPLMLGVKTLVLVGDPKQLPPTIISQDAKTHGMDVSLFARAENNFKNTFNNPILMLNVQYRMVDPIALWPNGHFYNGEITNADNIKVSFPLCHYKIFNHNATQSFKEFSNKPEAKIILKLLDAIVDEFEKIKIGDKNPSMSVITPYRDQQQIITDMILTECSKIEELLMAEFDKLNLHKKSNTNSKLVEEKYNDKIVCIKNKKRWYRNIQEPSVYIENKNETQIMPFVEYKNEIQLMPLIENRNEIKLMPLIENKNEIQLKPLIESKTQIKVNINKKDVTDKQSSSIIANDIIKIINGIAKLSLNCDNQVDKPQQKNFYVKNNELVKKFMGSSFGICRNNKKRKSYNKIIKSEEKKAKFDELKLFEQIIKDKIVKSKELVVSLFDKAISKIKPQDMNIKKNNEEEVLLTLKEIEETEITLKNIDKLFKLYEKWKEIEVNTVDSFQGQERDIIIMSCVRSRGIGFVADPNRLNVSLTRAKHTMIICGNFHAFRKNIMWRDLLVDAEVRGSYVNMNENIQSDDLKKLIFIK